MVFFCGYAELVSSNCLCMDQDDLSFDQILTITVCDVSEVAQTLMVSRSSVSVREGGTRTFFV